MSKSNYLNISSILNGTCVDGKGLRTIIFCSGCNLTCKFCQNIETLVEKGEIMSIETLMAKIMRVYPYIKKGGVTVSGGEPFLQAEPLSEFAKLLKEKNLPLAIETNGSIVNKELISLADEIIVDKKDFSIDSFLKECELQNKNITLTKVIIEGENDNEKTVSELTDLKQKFSCIHKIKLLPFVNLCKEKYKKLGLDYSFFERESTLYNTIKKLEAMI